MDSLRQRIADAAHEYVAARLTALGKPAGALDPAMDLFDGGVLDSLALEGLIAAVEHAAGRQIDFIAVDPEALGTLDGIVDELSRVLDARS